MAEGGFISYLRVSTDRQGKSGLGLEAQREAVRAYLNGGNWRIISEHVEVESGKRLDRPVLSQALAAARVHRAPLVVAKVDRLTRSLAFLTRLLEAGVDVRFCDLPQIEGPTGRFMLQQMAAVAELEAGMISTRTKAALAMAKSRGVTLGGLRRTKLSDEARFAGRASQTLRALSRAVDLGPVVTDLRATGATSLSAIAAGLTCLGVPTARGSQAWAPAQVARLLKCIDRADIFA